MKIYIDESGDFDFLNNKVLKYSIVGSIIIPESKEKKIADFFDNFRLQLSKNELKNKEIKGCLLSTKNRKKVCGFLSKNPDLKVSICVTDTKIINEKNIKEHRMAQVEKFKQNKVLYI